MPHLIFTLLIAIALSASLALLGVRPAKERIYAGAYFFLCCAFSTVAGSWLMHLIHG